MADSKIRPLSEMEPSTRARIEQAVLYTFSGSEFHKVSLIEIARQANVSLQTIYKYYGNKENLLFSSLETWLSRLAKRMIDHLTGIEDFKEKFRKVFWLSLEFYEKNPEVAQLQMSSVYLNTWRKTDTFRQPELMNVFVQVINEGKAKGVLNDDLDEKIIIDFIIGTASRNITMWVIRGEDYSLTGIANTLFEMIWRGIAKPAGVELAAPVKADA